MGRTGGDPQGGSFFKLLPRLLAGTGVYERSAMFSHAEPPQAAKEREHGPLYGPRAARRLERVVGWRPHCLCLNAPEGV